MNPGQGWRDVWMNWGLDCWNVFIAILSIIFVVIPVLLLVHFALTTDKDRIKQLIQDASSISRLQGVQAKAADKLLNLDGEIYPSDGCAITLSVLLQDAGIHVRDTFTAINLGRILRDRGWQTIPLGQQEAGDVGSTCGSTPHHGYDHIYLVLQKLNDDEMIVVDNQAPVPHFRYVIGVQDDTPTRFFLRASSLLVPGVKSVACGSSCIGGLGLLQPPLFKIPG